MDNFIRNNIASDGSNAGAAIGTAIRNARREAARKEYNYIVSIDWRDPGASFNYDTSCFLRYVTMQAKTFLKFIETANIGMDLMTFAQTTQAIGFKNTGLSRAQCMDIFRHFAPYMAQMEASKAIGSMSPEELIAELNRLTKE